MGICPLLAPDKKGGDNGGQDANGGNYQGVNGTGTLKEPLGRHTQSQGGDNGPHVAFK